jgi:hypothetical protein
MVMLRGVCEVVGVVVGLVESVPQLGERPGDGGRVGEAAPAA